MKRAFRVALILAAGFAAGCASVPSDPAARAQFEADHDPLEPLNRKTFAFNESVDRTLIKPLAKVYRAVLPQDGREMVRHFLDNLNDAEIQRALEVEGFPQISIRTIARWRREVGIYRSQSTNIQEATAAELQRVVSQELDSGTIEGYGKGLLQVHFRAMGIHASRFDFSLISLYTC